MGTLPVKKVNNSDAGDADHVGGNDWDDLSDWQNNVDKTGPVKINTRTYYRSGKRELRNPADTFSYVEKGSAILADRDVTEPLLTANDTRVYESHNQSLTNKTIDVKNNFTILRENSYTIFKDGSTYYSQKGDNGTHDSDAEFSTVFQNIIDDIADLQSTSFTKIKLAPGTYDVNTTIQVDDKYNIFIEGSGRGLTKIRAGPSLGDNPIWNFEGHVTGSQANLTDDTAVYDYSIFVSTGDAANFAVGDDVLLRSTKEWIASGNGSGFQGEIKRVTGVNTGTGEITFGTLLYDVYLTSDTANIIKLNLCKDISFANFTVDKASGYSPTTNNDDLVRWWKMKFVDRLTVRNVGVLNFTGRFGGNMAFRSCINVSVSDCFIETNTDNFQYGYYFADCCQNCVISNCVAKGSWRHAYEAGDGHQGTNEEGVCRNIHFVNCTAVGGSNSQFDTHTGGELISFVNCGVLGSSSVGGGFKLRAPRCSVIGCYVRGVRAGDSSIRLDNHAHHCTVANNYIVDCGADGIACYDDNDYNTIVGNHIEATGFSGIYFEKDVGTFTNIIISGNTIINTESHGIELTGVQDSMINNNIVTGNADYGLSLEAATCTNNMIMDNDFSNNTSGAIQNGNQTGAIEKNNKGYTGDTGTTFLDGANIIVGTSSGTKIGTATSQRVAFYNATPVPQRTGIADVNNSTVDNTYGQQENDVITSLRTKVNAILQVLEDMGITAVA